jgi:hypothetical protein
MATWAASLRSLSTFITICKQTANQKQQTKSIINIYLNEVYFAKYFAECKRKIHSENFENAIE